MEPGRKEYSAITIDLPYTGLETSWESIRETDPASKTREIFLGNGETLPASFNVDYKDIKEGRKIGDGQWGPVHKPEWNGRAVAVKKFNKTSQNVALMSREVTLMLRLRHPNILKLLGFYLLAQDDHILKSTMIMELMDCDLDVYIARCTRLQQHEGCLPLSKDDGLFIITEIARGMNHMHQLGYFHRDLKPQNVLVRKSKIGFVHIKIADFGCSEFMGGTSSNRDVGTLRYKAPEQFNPLAKLLPDKVDVYSFAVLCCKILTGNEPYGGHLRGLKLAKHIRNGGKPTILDYDLPADVAGLIKECLDTNPEARPDFQKICAILDPVMNMIWEKSPEKPLVLADHSACKSSHIQDQNGLPKDPYFINCDDIHLRRNIGGGGESDIYQVQWKGCMFAGRVVLHQKLAKKRSDLLTKLNHKNIVIYMGYSTLKNLNLLVMELMQRDLRALVDTKLKELRGTGSSSIYMGYGIIPLVEVSVKPFDEATTRYILKEIALGMAYLHSKDVLHGDLKTTNVLASEFTEGRPIIKLTDFGGGISSYSTALTAPEALKGFQFGLASKRSLNSDKKMEVYAFGMVCYEILTGIQPFDGKWLSSALRESIIRGQRPRLPDKTSQDLKDLIKRCWHQDPAMRPHFSEICEPLSKPKKPASKFDHAKVYVKQCGFFIWFFCWWFCLVSIPLIFICFIFVIKEMVNKYFERLEESRIRRHCYIINA